DADADWFYYTGVAGDAFCIVDPAAGLVANEEVRFCQFVACAESRVDLGTCPAGTTAAGTDGGAIGCCAMGADIPDFALVFDCIGEVTITMRVDQGVQGVCASYTVEYHF